MIWLKLDTKTGRGIHLHLPVSRNVLLELLDSILDLMTVCCFLAPKSPRTASHFSVCSVKESIGLLLPLLNSFSGEEPYDLVDVDTGNVKLSIKIR